MEMSSKGDIYPPFVAHSILVQFVCLRAWIINNEICTKYGLIVLIAHQMLQVLALMHVALSTLSGLTANACSRSNWQVRGIRCRSHDNDEMTQYSRQEQNVFSILICCGSTAHSATFLCDILCGVF